MRSIHQPCSFLVPLPLVELPLESYIRELLNQNFPGWREHEAELEMIADEELPWALLVEIPKVERPILIWPGEVDELPEEAWWSATDIQADERSEFERCHFGLVLEMMLDGEDDPRMSWRDLLIVALSLGRTAPLIYDENALRILPRSSAEWTADLPVAPPARELYTLHAIYDSKDESRLWLHTHGLGRTGIPDLDVLAVPEQHRQLAASLIALVADRLLDGVAEIGSTVSLGPEPGLALHLLPLQDVLDSAPKEVLGGDYDRDETHEPERAVLVAATGADKQGLSFFQPPQQSIYLDGLLARLERLGRLYHTEQEVERTAYYARYRWSVFLALWKGRKETGWRFLVRSAAEEHGPTALSRQRWFEVEEVRSNTVLVRPVGPAEIEPQSSADELVEISCDHVSDWSVSTESGAYSPINAVRLAMISGFQLPRIDPLQ